MIDIKTPREIEFMRTGGKALGRTLTELLAIASVGVSLNDIEARAKKRIQEAGGTPSFQTVRGYKWATCLCVNEVVVHGIPTEYKLKDGDLLTIDVGLLYQGFHTDTAWTKEVKSEKSKVKSQKEVFLQAGQEALRRGIVQARAGNRVGHISQAIQMCIEGAGYNVVRTLVGHGVGKELHEDPQIPGFLRGTIDETEKLIEGMTIAVEVIYAMGKSAVIYDNDDGWSIATKDRSLSAVFEHTVEVGPNGPSILTSAGD
ncbi:MAG: type I methionyl aminopeptidase [bacterium]|nr:type I methionyl aminopeptidase [bacterium]